MFNIYKNLFKFMYFCLDPQAYILLRGENLWT
jgi:hypothetical protein